MVTEHDSDFEDWPVEVDAIRLAVLPLIQHIFAVTADGSARWASGRSGTTPRVRSRMLNDTRAGRRLACARGVNRPNRPGSLLAAPRPCLSLDDCMCV
jgi:hypothetical protein